MTETFNSRFEKERIYNLQFTDCLIITMNTTESYEMDFSTMAIENSTTNTSVRGLQTISGVSRFSNWGLAIVSGAFVIICIWIIVLNGLLILCFWINKHEGWISHSKNILSIIIIDLLVGLTTLMSFLTSMTININRYECLVSMGSCLASQTATSLNVLRFCVTRFYAISKNSLKRESPTSIVVAQTLVIWIISVAIIIIPLTLWSGTDLVLRHCSWTYLFPTHKYLVNMYILNLLTIPTLSTTLLYGAMSLKLWKIRNFVHPISENTNTTRNASTSWTDSKMTAVQSRYCEVSDLSSGVGKQSLMKLESKLNNTDNIDNNASTSTSGKTHTCFTVAKETEFSTQISEVPAETNSNQLSVPVRNIKARVATVSPTVHIVPHMANRRTRISKVRTTIGILLVFINVSNLPYIIVITIQAIEPAVQLPAVIHPLALFFLMMNSAVNPVIYAIRMKPLRTAFFEMFKNCRNSIFANS